MNWYNPNCNETVGSEQGAGRPAVIVSNDYGNAHSSNVTVVYLTSQEKRPMSVHVPVICKVPSTALCEQIYTVSKERLGEYVRTCTDEEMQRINQGILEALGMGGEMRKVNDDAHRINEQEALLEAEKCNVSVLKKNLAEANEIIKARDRRIDELKVELESMEGKCDEAEETGHVAAIGLNQELIRAQTERDVYKAMFLQLQAQMMERKV